METVMNHQSKCFLFLFPFLLYQNSSWWYHRSHDEALSVEQMVDHTLVDGILGLSVEPLVQGDGELEAGICLLVWESYAVLRRKYPQLSWHSWDVLVPLFWWVFFHVKETVCLNGNRIFITLKQVIHRKKGAWKGFDSCDSQTVWILM